MVVNTEDFGPSLFKLQCVNIRGVLYTVSGYRACRDERKPYRTREENELVHCSSLLCFEKLLSKEDTDVAQASDRESFVS